MTNFEIDLESLETEFSKSLTPLIALSSAIDRTNEIVNSSKSKLNCEVVSMGSYNIAYEAFNGMLDKYNISTSITHHTESETDPRIMLNELVVHMEGFISGAKEAIIKIWEKLKEIFIKIKTYITTNFNLAKNDLSRRINRIKNGSYLTYSEYMHLILGGLDREYLKIAINLYIRVLKDIPVNGNATISDDKVKTLKTATKKAIDESNKLYEKHELANGIKQSIVPYVKDIEQEIMKLDSTSIGEEDRKIIHHIKDRTPFNPEMKSFTFTVPGTKGNPKVEFDVHLQRNNEHSEYGTNSLVRLIVTRRGETNLYTDSQSVNALMDFTDYKADFFEEVSDPTWFEHAIEIRLSDLEYTQRAYDEAYKYIEGTIEKALKSGRVSNDDWAKALREILRVLNQCSREFLKGI